MNNLENNKIFAAILLAGIVAMLCGFVAKTLTRAEHLEKDAVTVEAAAGGAGGAAAAAAGPEPILALIATADVAKGEQVHKACAACHSFEKGGANGVGPNLWNTVGNKKEHAAGFAYSGELAKVGSAAWTYDDLNHFLWKPKAYAPGTKMNYIGIKKPEDRAALIAWLRTQADSPAALPSQAEIDKEAAAAAAAAAPAPRAEATPAAATPAGEAAADKAAAPKAEAAPASAEKATAPAPKGATPAQLVPQPVKQAH